MWRSPDQKVYQTYNSHRILKRRTKVLTKVGPNMLTVSNVLRQSRFVTTRDVQKVQSVRNVIFWTLSLRKTFLTAKYIEFINRPISNVGFINRGRLNIR